MDFLNKFKKDLEKSGYEIGSPKPPRYWYSTGNYALNRIISGDFNKGVPQGRVTGLVGPSGAGKSFMTANLMKAGQEAGATVFVIDSEHALDDEFVSKVGVDPTKEDYFYVEATTITACEHLVSGFIKQYKADVGTDENAPQALIVIDSLDMLQTDREEDNFKKGITKGDMGQRNKQLKAMLRNFVQAIKNLNIAITVTGQVYPNQDVTNGEGLWIVAPAIRYSLSQIILLTKLKLKEGTEVKGIRMKCEGYKSRFCQPFQKVTIMVPYEEGIDPYSGLLDAAKALEVVIQKGAWYTLAGTETKFQAKNLDKYVDVILKECNKKAKTFLSVEGGEEIGITHIAMNKQRIAMAKKRQGE